MRTVFGDQCAEFELNCSYVSISGKQSGNLAGAGLRAYGFVPERPQQPRRGTDRAYAEAVAAPLLCESVRSDLLWRSYAFGKF